jgi:hypothetical protein
VFDSVPIREALAKDDEEPEGGGGDDDDDGGDDPAGDPPPKPDPSTDEIAAMAAAEGFFDLYGRGARVDAVIRAIMHLRTKWKRGTFA